MRKSSQQRINSTVIISQSASQSVSVCVDLRLVMRINICLCDSYCSGSNRINFFILYEKKNIQTFDSFIKIFTQDYEGVYIFYTVFYTQHTCTPTAIMFSWSTARPKGNATSTTYPGSRVTPVAQTVQGSIRPPEYTRLQHLESYLNDDVLKRSTRRVSEGMYERSRQTSCFSTTYISPLYAKTSSLSFP